MVADSTILSKIHKHIGDYLSDNFTTGGANPTYSQDNISIVFNFENEKPARLARDEYLLVFGINWNNIERREIGSNMFSFIGNIFINIFGPIDKGISATGAMENIVGHIIQKLNEYSLQAGETLNPNSVYINNFIVSRNERQSADGKYLITVGAIAQFNNIM